MSATLGGLLRQAREALKMPRREVCLLVSVSQEHFRKIEENESRPSPDLLIKLLDALDLNDDEQQDAWVLLAWSYLPPEVQAFVNITPASQGRT